MMSGWSAAQVGIAALAIGSPSMAQPQTTAAPGSAAEAQFAERVGALDRLMTAEAAKGGSYLLRYDRDAKTFVKSYGHLDCARTTPMRADALVDSGSITKAFTYAAIYKLVEEGRLKLDDRIGELFANVPDDKKGITVSQLLDGQSGFADFVGPDGSVPTADTEVILHDYVPLTKQQLLRSAFASPLQYAPGAKEEYSNLAYQLLAAIIEQASGRSYEEYVRERILLPAGMRSTGYVLPDYRSRIFAQQCKGNEAWGDPVTKGLWKNGVSWNLIGAGGMMTTLDDLRRWTDASVNGKLFRPDVQARYRHTPFFKPSYKRCATEVSAVAGSNNLTFAAYFDMPLREETLVIASTRSDHKVPPMLGILCPALKPEG